MSGDDELYLTETTEHKITMVDLARVQSTTKQQQGLITCWDWQFWSHGSVVGKGADAGIARDG